MLIEILTWFNLNFRFKNDVKIVHFIGAIKPWHHPYNTATGTVTPLSEGGHSQEYLQMWWNIFMEMVQPFLDPTLVSTETRTKRYYHMIVT